MANSSSRSGRRAGWWPVQGRFGSRWKPFGRPSDLTQNGPSLRQETLKYGRIPAASFLTLNHFASNLDGAIYEFTP